MFCHLYRVWLISWQHAANNLHLTGLYISHDTSLHILRIKSDEKPILTVIHNGTDSQVFLQKVTILLNEQENEIVIKTNQYI